MSRQHQSIEHWQNAVALKRETESEKDVQREREQMGEKESILLKQK